jgi:hypothetical protein
MILQDEFKKHGYTDLLKVNNPSEYGVDLADLYSPGKRPVELLGIFISEERDDLFILLNGNRMEIGRLCQEWDDRIRVFTIINGRSEEVEKFKYNIVQMIVYSGKKPDKSSECNLMMSRKIIIEGDLSDKNSIEIADSEAIELPFCMIQSVSAPEDTQRKQKLQQLLPKNKELLKFMTQSLRTAKRKEGASTQNKSLAREDYKKIKEWLENDHS